jgi:hypothetical protein
VKWVLAALSRPVAPDDATFPYRFHYANGNLQTAIIRLVFLNRVGNIESLHHGKWPLTCPDPPLWVGRASRAAFASGLY